MSFERLTLFGAKKCACGVPGACPPPSEEVEEVARVLAAALSGGKPAALLLSRAGCRACEAFHPTWREALLAQPGAVVGVEVDAGEVGLLRHALRAVRGADSLCSSVAAATPPTVVLVSRRGDHLVLRAPDGGRLATALARAAAVEAGGV